MTDLHLPLGPCHGSCVSFQNKAVLILGPSGAGKSELALALMAFGADLVADDVVDLVQTDQGIDARQSPHHQSLIEVRHIGLLRADCLERARINLIVDLARSEPDRLPPSRKGDINGVVIDLILGGERPNLEYSILQMLKGGRIDPDKMQ